MVVDKDKILRCLELSNGNPGAISVITQIINNFINYDIILNKMKEKDIVDYHIWVLYKENDKDINKFVKCFT